MEQQQSTIQIIKQVFKYFFLIKRNRWWILLAALVGATIGFLYAFSYKTTYKAEVSFVLEEETDKSFAGLSNIAKQLTGDGGKGMTNKKELLLEYLQSRSLLEMTLLKKVEVNGKTDLVINHFIDYNLNNFLEDGDPAVHNFRFHTDKQDSFNVTERQLLTQISNMISKEDRINGMIEKSGLIKMNYSDLNEQLAMQMTVAHINTLIEYYTNSRTEKARKTLQFTENRKDSVYAALQAAEYSLANFSDRNQGLVRSQGSLERIRLIRDVEILNAMYAEVLKNLETSKILLYENRPVVQVVDYPVFPLSATAKSITKHVIMYALLFAFLVIAIVVGVHLYKTMLLPLMVMAEEKKSAIGTDA